MGDRSRPIEAEQSVLGGIMLDNSTLPDVRSRLTLNDFGEPQHRVIFRAQLELEKAKEPIDEITVTSWLRDRGELEKAGGAAGVTMLVERIPTAANIEHYAGVVRQASCVRAIYLASKKAMADLAGGADLEEVLASLTSATSDAAAREPDQFGDIVDDFGEILREMERRHENGVAQSSESFVRTGYPMLDAKLIGFGQAQMIVVAAKSGVGKTALALNFAARQTMAGERIAFFSGEMKRRSIARRLFACTAPVHHHLLRAGLFGDDDWPRAVNALAKIERGAFQINDTITSIQQVCALSIRAAASSQANGKRLSVVYVDYLQRLVSRVGGGRGDANREQQVAAAALELKNLSRRLDIAVVVMSQLNKAGEARESDAIFHEADVFMELDRPGMDEGDERDTTLKIKKQRDGSRGDIKLEYRGEIFRFDEPLATLSTPRPSAARTSWLEKTDND